MSDWTAATLFDIVDIIGGGTPKTSIKEYWNGEIPWLSVVDFNNGLKYVTKTEKHISDLGLMNSSSKKLETDDIIISARGTVGAMAVLKSPMAFNQSCYGIRGKQGVCISDFVYYLLKDSVNKLQLASHGGVFDTITKGTFKQILVQIPKLSEQQAIAEILSSIDDKIDLLNRQNETLEAMAQTLFRQWFIEEADESWEEVELGALLNIQSGYVHSNEELVDNDGSQLLSMGAIGKAFYIDRSKPRFIHSNKIKTAHVLGEESIVISTRDVTQDARMLGLPVLPDVFTIGSIVGSNLYHITPVGVPRLFIFHLMRTIEFRDYVKSVTTGSTILMLRKQDLIKFTLRVPRDFKNMHGPIINIHSKIEANLVGKNQLEALRDTLLPKLMSGEVRVKLD